VEGAWNPAEINDTKPNPRVSVHVTRHRGENPNQDPGCHSRDTKTKSQSTTWPLGGGVRNYTASLVELTNTRRLALPLPAFAQR